MSEFEEKTSVTAPLTVISKVQQGDIANSFGPKDILGEVYRSKQYVKDDEKRGAVINGYSPRCLSFPQPWQWAAQRWSESGGYADPRGIDRVFLGQLGVCNLRCDECYAGCYCGIETVDVSAEDYVSAYYEYCRQFGYCGTLRISGGEPLLFQEWTCEVIEDERMLMARDDDYVTSDDPLIVWVDTNLTIKPKKYLLGALSASMKNTAVCGCFKPNRTWADGTYVSIEAQLEIVGTFVERSIPLFLYWPAWDKEHNSDMFIDVLESLYKIHSSLPLRMTVIETHKYDASPGMENIDDAQLMKFYRDRAKALDDFLLDHYHPDVIMLPSHLTLSL